jgi:NitT/TauT family transport system substrate-binding protein
MMYLVAAPQGQVRTTTDLRGVEVGVSTNSVIEFATDKMLADAGLRDLETKRVEVAKIPVRFEMLMKGQLQAATLPDPFGSLALAQGARLIADDSASGAGQSVMTFRQEVIDQKPAAVRAFLTAYEQGVAAINANPSKYRALLVDRAKVPEQIKDTFAMPAYPPARVPTEAEVAAVSQWMVGKGLLPAQVNYAKLVTSEFLPKR